MKALHGRVSLVLVAAVCCSVFAREIHVSKSGSDGAAGDAANPYLTVSKAASVAQPGDTTTIHAGIYREFVNPPRGGTSETARITYRAATGETATLSGAERITTWVSQGSGVWKVDLPSTFFGSRNPYTIQVDENYCNYGCARNGGFVHCGLVYLNDEALHEVNSLSSVQGAANNWYCSTSGSTTSIYANFGSANPNTEMAEINVREMVFNAPSGTGFIALQGLHIEKAATNWQPPSGIQEAMVCIEAGQRWIIEDCVLRYGRAVGISLTRGSNSPTTTGHHIIRNNIIQRCGQGAIAGCCGSHFASEIYGNLMEDINYLVEFGGAESAAIKLHFSKDVVIRNNCIRRVYSKANVDGHGHAIWLDCGTQ